MNTWSRFLQSSAWLAVGGVVVAFLAGCNNFFVPKHRVMVDAICAPDFVAPTTGTSYRLVAKKSVVTSVSAQVSVIKACVDAALMGKGMFESPANVAPDIVIEVGYGVDTTPRVNTSARETFLQLSARSNPAKSFDRGTGPELWDVRVSVLGVTGRLETAMPLLAAVASDYLGTDTKLETRIEIPQNAPAIGAVRATAIKTLEGNAPGAPVSRDAPSAAAAANAAVQPVTTK